MFRSKLLIWLVFCCLLLAACNGVPAGPTCWGDGWEPVEDEVALIEAYEEWGVYSVYLRAGVSTMEVWLSLPDREVPLGNGQMAIPKEGGTPVDVEVSHTSGVFLLGYGHISIKQCNGRLYYKRLPIAKEGPAHLLPAPI
ncbi:hypothetical protein A3F07_01985 [candidate division WWE3 bacterium RIFCSPHIGHO2_12_FULL_38_15]|uniref:Lipoprotein n=1 Tax=candidate division WWE3 bacterium RIFCSPHIGHO2_02_FULL_38_14 TaxID=1802620 RepID=A0A1F4V918_UNCKA|nr:MAG: hypothetical protein A2793_03220 [candidate division WWE3 bacterium RIFCSPHIGHO2_01_FULL_38_45]OGC48651.1 MAG: hypothetical protein A3F07_01985 [candidate division WWE3 bacterium RIFCSPHIGHO2_12_FULL_38_15]OGC53057.1 MAG: hypothetical protein A3B64_01245 [candidate division WWE3 bacterium RIFCSPLOWO2_01_FULL_37_24]OGC53420.1 MAG: hypothetical protein A3D91_00100 [candidate division WWE3 bacterium RIFCSPHIGHO2_02_FULL_38_14]HLB51894.1 hypothetical protein [Patescibacteria group bacterium